ncbi:MAG: RNA polymerase sigma-70 factor [Sediminibacterium sp.]|nr:RNA polymerase sigma-70 factor [Sediminibacterium sp.]
MNLHFTDIETYEALFRKHYAQLCHKAFMITGNKEHAEDLVQEVFVKIWENRKSIEIKTSAFSYLYRSVINACYNDLNKVKVIRPVHQIDNESFSTPSTSGTDVAMDYALLQQEIEKAIERLPPKCKTIFVMSRQEGYKYKEIADLLNISMKTVEGQMSIALAKISKDLKPVLEKHFPDLILLGIIAIIFSFWLQGQ